MIAAGEYNKRIHLQAPVDDANSYNEQVTTYQEPGTPMWAKITSPRGAAKIAAMQSHYMVDLLVRIRWREVVNLHRHRIVWRGTPYAIVGVSDAGPAGGYIEMQCTSGIEGAN